MNRIFSVLVVATIGIQWAMLGSWALERDLSVYRGSWSDDAVVAVAPAAPVVLASVTP